METPSTSAPPAGPGDASKTTLERGAKKEGVLKKRKPVDFSLADLDADAQLNDEVKFNLKTSNSSGKRDVPKRSCIKKASSSTNEYEET